MVTYHFAMYSKHKTIIALGGRQEYVNFVGVYASSLQNHVNKKQRVSDLNNFVF